MNKKQKAAVAIARDVLAQLDAKKIVAKTGVYLVAGNLKTGDLKSQLTEADKKGKKCTVCAVGAMFVAKVKRDNHFTVNNWNSGVAGIERDEMSGLLVAEAFTTIELSNIEMCFEQTLETSCPVILATMNNLKHATRLRVIMEEVIAQRGYFDLYMFEKNLINRLIKSF